MLRPKPTEPVVTEADRERAQQVMEELRDFPYCEKCSSYMCPDHWQPFAVKQIVSALASVRTDDGEKQDALDWVEQKIRTVYQSPASDRRQLQRIQGSMHVICAGYDTWKRLVKDAASLKDRIAELESQLSAARREARRRPQ